MLNLIGIGLGDINDLTLKALDALKNSDKIYFENYTSFYASTKEEIEEFIGKEIIISNREVIEDNQTIFDEAKEKKVSIMIIGDIFAATTHVELYQNALKQKIKVNLMFNTSILTAIGLVGLELYKFGKITSIPFVSKGFFPITPYSVYENNKKMGLHTLMLLDLRPNENKFMSVNEALEQLLEIEKKENKNIISKESKLIGCARLGRDDFKIKFGSVKELLEEDFGKPPHCIIFPGKLHFLEEEMLENWK